MNNVLVIKPPFSRKMSEEFEELGIYWVYSESEGLELEKRKDNLWLESDKKLYTISGTDEEILSFAKEDLDINEVTITSYGVKGSIRSLLKDSFTQEKVKEWFDT